MSLPGQVLQGILARGALVLLRVYLGAVFLVAALPKLRQDFTPDLTGFVQQVALQRAHQFYRPFLEQVVLPNAPAFAALVTWVELLSPSNKRCGTGQDEYRAKQQKEKSVP